MEELCRQSSGAPVSVCGEIAAEFQRHVDAALLGGAVAQRRPVGYCGHQGGRPRRQPDNGRLTESGSRTLGDSGVMSRPAPLARNRVRGAIGAAGPPRLIEAMPPAARTRLQI